MTDPQRTCSTACRYAVLALCVLLQTEAARIVQAQAVDAPTLRRKQDDQQRARAMARELMLTVLDVQLRQLEENGLTDVDVYRDVNLMRQSIEAIVETEMTAVVQLLTEAQSLAPAERDRRFVEARQMIRTIIMKLSAERRTLLRRLKIAELTEQVQRLIDLQTATQNATLGLPNLQTARRDEQVLKTTEDQRDVADLFLHLVESLSEVRSWGGPLSEAATAGLRLLKAANATVDLEGAITSLSTADYAQAARHQEQTLVVLKSLLRLLQQTQGVIGSEGPDQSMLVKAAIQEQQRLRELTRQLDTTQPSAELVEQQAKVQKQLATLQDQLMQTPELAAHLEPAQARALDATANLFEGKTTEAIEDQSRVLGHLAAIEALLAREAPAQRLDLSATQAAQRASELKQVQEELSAARQQQQSAEEQGADRSPAAQTEEQVASEVQRIAEAHQLSATLEERLDHAAATARQAAKELQSAPEQPADAAAQQAVERAGTALDRAIAAVDRAAQDADDLADALRLGELARASEVLERAAAEERLLATAAEQLQEHLPTQMADSNGAEAAQRQAHELAERQEAVSNVVNEVARGLAETASQVARQIESAGSEAQQSAEQLQSAAKELATGTESAETTTQLTEASERASHTADQLSTAADELRAEIARAAQALAERNTARGDALQSARDQLESSVGPLPDVRSLDEQRAALASALDQTQAAQARQLAAAGQPLAAKAIDVARALDYAAEPGRTPSSPSTTPPAASSGQTTTDQVTAEPTANEAVESNNADPAGAANPQTTAAQQAAAYEAAAQAAAALAQDARANPIAASPDVNTASPDGTSATEGPRPSNVADVARQAAEAAQTAAEAARRVVATAPLNDDTAAIAQAALAQAQQRAATTADALRAAAADAATQAAKSPPATAPHPGDAPALAAAATEQQAANRAIADAAATSADVLPAAEQNLREALTEGEAAAQQLMQPEGDAAQAASAQQQALAHLAQAQQALTAAQDRLDQQAVEQLAEFRRAANEAAAQVAQQSPEVADVMDRAATQPRATPAGAASDAEPATQPSTSPADAGAPSVLPIEQALDQASAMLAADEVAARRNQELAGTVAGLAEQQRTAAQTLANQRSLAEQPMPANGAGSTDSPTVSPQMIAKAAEQFAAAQQATGEATAQLSGQSEIGNEALRRALELAAQLGQPNRGKGTPATTQGLTGLRPQDGAGRAGESDPSMADGARRGDSQPGQPATSSDAEIAPADASDPGAAFADAAEPFAGSAGASGNSKTSNQRARGDMPNDASSADSHGQSMAAAGQGSASVGDEEQAGEDGESAELGTGFVPKSPELTARMMAGPGAMAALRSALGSDQSSANARASKGSASRSARTNAAARAAQGSQSPSASKQAQANASSAAGATASTTSGATESGPTVNSGLQDGQPTQEQIARDAPASARGTPRDSDESIRQRTFEDEAWFAKLPPELRKSLQSGTQRRAPRAYEQKLRRYFESVD